MLQPLDIRHCVMGSIVVVQLEIQLIFLAFID
jgi:hypothetical protein